MHLRAQILRQGWSDAYVNKHLSALRRVLEEAWLLGGALLAACLADDSPAGARDAALIAVLDSCGLRRLPAPAPLRIDIRSDTAGVRQKHTACVDAWYQRLRRRAAGSCSTVMRAEVSWRM